MNIYPASLQLKGTYQDIQTWRGKSGVSWDDEKGANIVGQAAEEMFKTFILKVSFLYKP